MFNICLWYKGCLPSMSFLSSHFGGRKSILKKQFLCLTMLQLQAVTLISFMVDTCKKVKKKQKAQKTKLLSGS